MTRFQTTLGQRSAYAIASIAAIVSAICLELFASVETRPVIGGFPLFPATIFAAGVGLLLITFLEKRGASPRHPMRVAPQSAAKILLLGGILALPPIMIDVALGFPEDLNLPLPDALFFYPGIALVAEVVFHLLPLALLSMFFLRTPTPAWLIWPVVIVEPIFQLSFLSGPGLLGVLVLANVSLVSAAQLWLFQRHGFLVMIGLRLAFYFFWHIAWGQLRLVLLY